MKSYRREDIDADIQQHIRNVVDAQLNGSKKHQMLNEMALPLKEYIKRIEDLMYQLVENWCLCKWCQMFDPENINFNHWKEELNAYAAKLSAPKLKNSIGKKKHLEKYLVEWYDLDEVPMVLSVINHKFNKEHINDKSQRAVAAQAFAGSIHALIDAIAAGSEACESYLETEFAK